MLDTLKNLTLPRLEYAKQQIFDRNSINKGATNLKTAQNDIEALLEAEKEAEDKDPHVTGQLIQLKTYISNALFALDSKNFNSTNASQAINKAINICKTLIETEQAKPKTSAPSSDSTYVDVFAILRIGKPETIYSGPSASSSSTSPLPLPLSSKPKTNSNGNSLNHSALVPPTKYWELSSKQNEHHYPHSAPATPAAKRKPSLTIGSAETANSSEDKKDIPPYELALAYVGQAEQAQTEDSCITFLSKAVDILEQLKSPRAENLLEKIQSTIKRSKFDLNHSSGSKNDKLPALKQKIQSMYEDFLALLNNNTALEDSLEEDEDTSEKNSEPGFLFQGDDDDDIFGRLALTKK